MLGYIDTGGVQFVPALIIYDLVLTRLLIVDIDESFGLDRPLDKRVEQNIMAKISCLIKCIDLNNGLLDLLVQRNCISEHQRQVIETRSTATESRRELLEMICRRSMADYSTFLACLKDNNQDDVVRLINDLAGMVL